MAETSQRALDPDHIDLWLAYYQEITDESLLAQQRALLTEDERQQEKRFYFPDDQRRYLVTRALVRTVLSRYADVAPWDWTFAKNDYGRPAISNGHRDAAGLRFNISHTKGLIALGVTRDRELGVDVENLATRQLSDGIAERFFSPSEAAELAGTPADGFQRRFFEYWTFKEAYIKARGMGLSIPLDRFSFHYPDERTVRLQIDPELGDAPERWRFVQFQPSPDYLLAVCAECVGSRSLTCALHRVVPLQAEAKVDAKVLKST